MAPGEARVSEHLVEPLTEGDPNVKGTPIIVDPLTEGTPNVKGNEIQVDPLTEGTPNVKITPIIVEPLSEGTPGVRCSVLLIEALVPIPEEEHMSTEIFPGFGNSTADPSIPEAKNPFSSSIPGISYGIHKKPSLNTRKDRSASGILLRNALQEYPIWKFEFSYEFLEDRSGADSSLKTILGFFLKRLAGFDSFLVKDPDDYLVQLGWIADTDGVTTEFPLTRGIGGFYEPVGQVDENNSIDLWYRVVEPHVIPASPGPYIVTVTNAADFAADEGVTKGGVAMTKVTSSPAAGEYSVDEVTGEYTFNATDESDAISITYRFNIDPSDYTITMPNSVVFDSAPADGLSIVGSFQFFFVCVFSEDELDFEKFADQLWNLQTCEFESILE